MQAGTDRLLRRRRAPSLASRSSISDLPNVGPRDPSVHNVEGLGTQDHTHRASKAHPFAPLRTSFDCSYCPSILSDETITSEGSFIGSRTRRFVSQFGQSILFLYEEAIIKRRMRSIETWLLNGDGVAALLRRVANGDKPLLLQYNTIVGDLLELTR